LVGQVGRRRRIDGFLHEGVKVRAIIFFLFNW